MEKLGIRNKNDGHSLLKNIFNRDFVISAIIPVVIFSVFNKFKMPLDGIILSGLWSVSVVLISYIKEHKINALAAL